MSTKFLLFTFLFIKNLYACNLTEPPEDLYKEKVVRTIAENIETPLKSIDLRVTIDNTEKRYKFISFEKEKAGLYVPIDIFPPFVQFIKDVKLSDNMDPLVLKNLKVNFLNTEKQSSEVGGLGLIYQNNYFIFTGQYQLRHHQK